MAIEKNGRGEPQAVVALPATKVDEIAERLRSRGKPFQKGNTVARGRKLLSTLKVNLPKAEAPAMAKMQRDAETYRRHRIRELMVTYGYVGTAVSAAVASSAYVLSASRYLYDLWSQNQRSDILAEANRLSAQHIQMEMKLMEICSREAAAKGDDANKASWFTTGEK